MLPPGARVVVAPDKFKGTLTAAEAADHIAAGLLAARPDLDVVRLPVADGGDGTVDAAVAVGFTRVPVTVSGPLGDPVAACYARRGTTAIVELAEASGLRRLPGGTLAPLTAASHGTGELIAAALTAGARRIVLGLGGSACTDGGTGMATALGFRFLSPTGPLPPGGGALHSLTSIERAPAPAAEIVVASDVASPLLGPHGAATVFAPQKGATPADVALLEAGLAHLAALAGPALAARPGAGAAGGTGFGALAFLAAALRPGIGYLLDLLGFQEALAGAALVITGEGSLDPQTLTGKAPLGVARAARNVPTIALCGRLSLTPAQLTEAGFHSAHALDPATAFTAPGAALASLAATLPALRRPGR